jgi:hypothetical protein
VLGDLDGDGFEEFLLFDPGLPQLDGSARAAFWLLSSRDWNCRGGDVDLPPTAGRMSAVLLPDQNGDGCLDFAVMEEGLFGFPGGLAVYSGANAAKIRAITLQSNEQIRGAWCVPSGSDVGLAWLTRDGERPAVAVHSEGNLPSVPQPDCDALGLETIERVIALDADEAQPEVAFAVVGKGRDRTGSARMVVLLCDTAFGQMRGRWEFPADHWVRVVACRAPDGESLAAILDGQNALLVRAADGTVRMSVRIDENTLPPATSACILSDEPSGPGRLLLGIVGANLHAGCIDEYALYVADLMHSIQPRSMDGYQFGCALGVVRGGPSSFPILVVGTDCRLGGCEGGVVLVEPRDGHEIGRFARVSGAQLHFRE